MAEDPKTDDSTVSTDTPASAKQSPRAARWLGRIDRCKTIRRKLLTDWSKNVDYRRGKQFDTDSDEDRVPITIDWSATKAKQAQLFSVRPEVRLTPKKPAYAPATATYAKRINDELARAGAGQTMDECLPDIINAAGIGAYIVTYESRQEERSIPSADPMQVEQLRAQGQPVPMTQVPMAVSKRFAWTRISPGDLLWPAEFDLSDFDRSPWIGRSGRCTWSEAKFRFKLTDEDKEKVIQTDTRTAQDRLTPNDERDRGAEPLVEFDEVFYWRFVYHTDETNFEAIQHIVFVGGKDEPAIDERWKGQKLTKDGRIVGSCKRPIRVGTLTYISDEAIPPSDSAMGRPQVDELIKSRSQVVKQREANAPMRWMDVNRVDPQVQVNLMRGTWQGIIPVNGDGSRSIGEVARASYPREDFEFDRVAKGDLAETWQVAANQLGGNSGTQIRSATEANAIQANFQTRIGYERARIVSFFLGGAEVLAGLLALYGDFEPDEAQALSAWNPEELNSYYIFDTRVDASVLLDAEQQLSRLEKFLNLTAKSGYVNVKPIIEDMAALSGLDPARVVIDPPPPPPEPMNISLRASGVEDLLHPMVLALLKKTGQAPSPQEIEEAKQLILQAQAGPLPPAQPPPVPGGGSAGPGMDVTLAGAPQPPIEDAMPDYNTMTKIEKRQDDGSNR